MKDWTVERKPGTNPMSRIMEGEQVVIGWTMRPFSDVFEKLCTAHNTSIRKELFELGLAHGEAMKSLERKHERTHKL